MIAGFLPPADAAVDLGSDETAGERRAEQQMVDAQPGVSRKRIPKVIPECVDALARVKRAQRVDPPLFDQAMEGGADFRAKQRANAPAHRHPGRWA